MKPWKMSSDSMARVKLRYCQNCRGTGGVVWFTWKCGENWECKAWKKRRDRDQHASRYPQVFDAVEATGAHFHGRWLCAGCRELRLL